ncbi:MAG: Dipeptide transport system permease protein DppC [bacterium ADurb.Bin478]|nr:MAG: Dipeptide transport system permease protein DppC [bacterium ADurb.Bin478]
MMRTLLIRSVLLLATIGLLWLVPVHHDVQLDQRLQPPSASHWMGTDDLGRDLAARVTAGCRLSLSISLLAWAACLGLGLMAGGLAGYWADHWIGKLIDLQISITYIIPFTVFLITLLALFGPGLAPAYLILVLLAWAAPARQTRAAVLQLKSSRAVTAAWSFGYPPTRVIRQVMLPQLFRPVLISSLAVLPEIIALDAGLSFLGLGAPPPTPTLGKLINDGISYYSIAWWMPLFPVLALMVICWAVRFLFAGFTGRPKQSSFPMYRR